MKRLHSFFYVVLFFLICVCYVTDTNAQFTDTTAVVEEEYQEDENEHFKSTIPDTPVVRFIPDSVTSRLRRKKEYAYANDPSFWIKPKQEESEPGFWENFDRFLRSSIVRLIFYLLLGSLIIFIIYRLIVGNDLFIRTTKVGDKETNNSDVKDLIDDDQLDKKINTAIRNRDHRLAIRFLYIKTLQLLHQKNLIRYHAESTNETYVQQMSNSLNGKDFRFLTQVFEYVWYGEFPLTPEQFETIHKDFRQFHNKIH